MLGYCRIELPQEHPSAALHLPHNTTVGEVVLGPRIPAFKNERCERVRSVYG